MINVLVITHNRIRYLKKCINSILKQDTEIILNVWDNNSSDGTKKYLRKLVDNNILNGIFFDCKRNFGTAIARNSGIAAINDKYIFISDDDMYHSKSCIRLSNELMELLNKNDSYAVIGTYNPFEGEQYKRIQFDEFKIDKFLVHRVTGLPPGAWLLDKDIIEFYGGFKLPDNKLMGFSSWKLPERMGKGGFNFAYLCKYANRIVNSEHMDNIKHKLNEVAFYEESGYNGFRRKQKGT